MKTIVVTNNKGGVGKTTTTHMLAEWFSKQKKKVLLIDGDAQANLSLVYGFNDKNVNKSIFDLLTNNSITLEECVYHTNNLLVDIIPSSIELQDANYLLQSNAGIIAQLVLKQKLNNCINYDVIIIDTAPNIDMVLYNMLAVATDLLIPIKADLYSVKGIGMLLKKIEQFNITFGSNPNRAIFQNCYKESKTHREFYEMVKTHLPNFKATIIKDRVALNRNLLNEQNIHSDKAQDSRDAIEQFNELFIEIYSEVNHNE